jgi:L-ascorbate metabolism protein UlaG (beta-lactamase superfamily)
MKVKYVSHASMIIQLPSGTRILTDPWYYSPVYGSALYQFPIPAIKKSDILSVDYIYISHDHPDHFCPNSLALFPKNIKIILRQYGENCPMTRELSNLGFINFVKLEDRAEIFFDSDSFLKIYFDESSTDSLAVISSNGSAVFFQNDCMLDANLYEEIGRSFNIKLSLQHFSNSSCWPTSFNLPEEIKRREARVRDLDKFQRAISLARILRSKVVVPIANDMVPLRSRKELEYRPPIATEFADYCVEHAEDLLVVAMVSGDAFDIESMTLDRCPSNNPISTDEWDREISKFASTAKVKKSIDAIEKWESQFEFDLEDFRRQLTEYFEHINSTGQYHCRKFHVTFRVICEKNECHLISLTCNEKWTITEKHSKDFVIEIAGNLLAILCNGGYTFEDFLNSRYSISRKADFSEEESNFWLMLAGFSPWQANHVQRINRPGYFCTLELSESSNDLES